MTDERQNRLEAMDTRVNNYIRDNRIVILPIDGDDVEIFTFYGGEKEIGKMVYDRKSKCFKGCNAAQMRQRLQTKGLVTVMKDFARLLIARDGDFYHHGFNQLHDILNTNEE